MKLKEAIDRIDEMRPNTAPEEEKLRWIDSFDRMVRKEIIDAHGTHRKPRSPVTIPNPHTTRSCSFRPLTTMYTYICLNRV